MSKLFCLFVNQAVLIIISCFARYLFPIFFKLFRSRFFPIFEEGAKFQVDLSLPHIATHCHNCHTLPKLPQLPQLRQLPHIATIATAKQPHLTLWFMLAAIVPERNVGPRLSVIAANLKEYWRCQIKKQAKSKTNPDVALFWSLKIKVNFHILIQTSASTSTSKPTRTMDNGHKY